MSRPNGRAEHELREVKIERNFTIHAEGSVLVSFGNTKVLCNASFTPGVPRFKKDSGEGWVTAEYAMLKIGGRTHEISRLIGRSLRAVIDVKALGENTIVLDCDVLQADGGTRTAAITGAFVALADAVAWAKKQGLIAKSAKPLIDTVSAVSVGIIDGVAVTDLEYVEDVRADTDMNVVVTGRGLFVEVQGTAEAEPFDRDELNRLLEMALDANKQLAEVQRLALGETLEIR